MRIHRSGAGVRPSSRSTPWKNTAYHEKSKKDKGLSAAMWLLQSEGKRFLASKTTVSALEKVTGTTLGKVRSRDLAPGGGV